MGCEKLARLMLLPAMLLGQDPKLSDAAQRLVNEPRLGSAQLTWADGRTQQGRIARVTDQFIAFETSIDPPACENVELSKVVAVQWLGTPRPVGERSREAGAVFLIGAVLAPSYVGNAVADPFKRISPPQKPLRGSWVLNGPSHSAVKSSLVFTDVRKGGRATVQYRTITSKRGRWSVEHDLLRLTFDGEPDSVTSFHFDCGELILDNPTSTFRETSDRKRATPPIVGDWHASNYNLDLKPDGRVVEQKWEVRKGTFENTSTSVKMHWTDSTGPGGAEWIAQIEHRHILVSVGGVLMKYHYVPPEFSVDL